jgi:DNA-binding transcriptional LysR family regulator
VAARLDLAIVNLPVEDPEVEVTPLFDEELVLLAPRDSPLADRTEITLVELAAHPLVLPPRGSVFRDDLDAEAHRAGVTLEAMAEIEGVRLMTSLAFEGFGPTIAPSTAVPGWLRSAVSPIPIVGLPPRHVGLAHRRLAMPSASARALAAVLYEVVAAGGSRQQGVIPVVGATGAV